MKPTIMLGFVVVMLVASGCSNGGFGGRPTPVITDTDVQVGFGSLDISFVEGAPPERVFEDSQVPIGIRIANEGAADVEQSILVLAGEKIYLSLDEEDETTTFDLEGKSSINPRGSEEFFSFQAASKFIDAQSEKRTTTLLATACFDYETEFGTSVCIDPDVFGQDLRDKACEVKELTFGKGQGSPISITSIETRMLPDLDNNEVRPHFLIHVENKGGGQVLAPGNVETACSNQGLGRDDYNRIQLTALLADQHLDCDSGFEEETNNLRLKEGKDVIRCSLDQGIPAGQDAYSSLLTITINFGYTVSTSQSIIIEKIA